MFKLSAVRRLLLTLAWSLVLVLSAASALAAGRVEWKTKTFKERDDKSWRLELAIYLPKAPDVAYVPMKFEFEPQVYYERALVDGTEGPVERKIPLEGRQPLIEGVDVGFLETGSAKIESRTKFTFKVKRDLGYDAGEYKVTVRDTRNGQVVGTPTNIIFDGQNEIIDRRSIVFSGEKKKKKPEPKAEGSGDGSKDDGKKDEGNASKDEGSKDDGSSDDGASKDEGGGDEGPEPIKEKPGGCGCRVPGAPAETGLAFLPALGLAAFLLGRRRLTR